MKNNLQDQEQTYFDSTQDIPEYTLPGMTESEINLMLLYRLLSPEQQEQIFDLMGKSESGV